MKVFGDPLADTKYKKTKKLGKQPEDDMYNFYGDYDLTQYLEELTAAEQTAQKKNLCLC